LEAEMKRGDMVKHVTDEQRPRGVVTNVWQGGVLVQWNNGETVRYEGQELQWLAPLGWNLYVR